MRKEKTVQLLMVVPALALLAACGGSEPNREGCYVDFAEIEGEVVCDPLVIWGSQGMDITINVIEGGFQVQAHLPQFPFTELPPPGEETPAIITVNEREGCFYPPVEGGAVVLHYNGSSPQKADFEILGVIGCDDGPTDLYVYVVGVDLMAGGY